MMITKADYLIEKMITDIFNDIGNKLDREVGLPIESDAPRLRELLLLDVKDRVKIIDIINDVHNDRYYRRGIFKKSKK